MPERPARDLPTTPSGLTQDEAAARAKAGRGNVDRSRPSRTYAQVLRANVFTFFNNILFVIGAGLLALGRTNDAVVSVGLGLINAVVGAAQEVRAKRTLDALRLLHRSQCTVVRDGTDRRVDPEQVVEGELLRLSAGDQVVVDGPLVGLGGLEVDESLLTGESVPVRKAEGDRLLSGSAVLTGSALQRAEAVGAASYASTITAAARTWTPQRTPLQAQVDLVVRAIMLLVALLSMAILLQAALGGISLVRVVQISAVLSGLVPYGLFFLVTVAYATGAATISRRGALVQQLNAVESLSNVDVVCTDKTGTLTTGLLDLRDVVPLAGHPADQVRATLAVVAASATAANATTRALVAALPGTPVPLEQEVPFSSARRWSGVRSRALGGAWVLGAPEALRPALEHEPTDLDSRLRELTGQGLRVLMLASGGDVPLTDDVDSPTLPQLQAVALIVFGDELRPQAREAVQGLLERGVTVKVVSGDDPHTVAALVAQLGLVDIAPVAGPDLAALPPEQFDEVVAQRSVFGRIAPEQKEQLVDALRRRGYYTAMVGDGVNDARSLKRAHVGIAMESGTAVTRDVADLVLLGDSFAAVAPAQVQGQRIISGISVSLHLFLTRVLASIVVILGVGVLDAGFPYEPAQVGLTLFSVGIPSLLLTAWAAPEPPDPHLLRRVLRFSLTAGVVTGVFGVLIYAGFYTLLVNGLQQGLLPADAVERFEAFTGLADDDPDFPVLAATGVAQTALSMFTTLTAFLLILFLAPPSRLFTGWTGVTRDRRPALLALGLLVAFLVVLLTPALAEYFGLLRPDDPIAEVTVAATVLWFFVLRACFRHHLPERLLGLPPSSLQDHAQLTPGTTASTRADRPAAAASDGSARGLPGR